MRSMNNRHQSFKRKAMPLPTIVLLSSLILLPLFNLVSLADGHSKLMSPTTNVHWACHGPHCSQTDKFCPGCRYETKSEATYRRGEVVTFRWAKNNHFQSGIVKFSIVPISDKCSGPLHKKLTFHYTCWGTGLYSCEGKLCHTDSSGRGWSGKVKIPTVVPDGEYFIGWLWYGGAKSKKEKNPGVWSDYYSCSHVTVKGGPMEERFPVKFDPADSDYANKGGCFTATDKVGVCASGKDCASKSPVVQPPEEFKDGKKPKDLTPADFDDGDITEGEDHDSSSSPPPGKSNVQASANSARNPPIREPEDVITAFQLVNADSDEILPQNLLEKSEWTFTIGTSDLPSVNMVVQVSSRDVEKMQFYVNDKLFHTEEDPPFAIGRNRGKNYRPWKLVEKGGKFKIKAVAIGPDDVILEEESVTLVFKV